MMNRAARLAGLVAIAAIVGSISPPATALERHRGLVVDDGPASDWNASQTCSVVYYNMCTGWTWIWDHFVDGERVGTVFETCCGVDEEATLDSSWLYYPNAGVPAGRGFTGAISVYAVDDDDCPTGPPIAEASWLPFTGWNQTLWTEVAVPSQFVVIHTLSDEHGFGLPVGISSDGPQSCGVCFPTTRAPHSYLYGTEVSPLCPGSPLQDLNCYVEWLALASFSCVQSSAVQESSWGAIKELYR